MAFATPWFLLGLLGIGIPIAIHLIRRQRTERVMLPTVRFLKPAPRKHVYFQQLKQWLLLALRVAIVALLAVAFARPLLTGVYPRMAGRSPKSVAILLDASMSMQYAGRFKQGKKAAIDIIDSLNPGDEAGVTLFADVPGRMQALTTAIVSSESTCTHPAAS